MRNAFQISDDEKWEAVSTSDKNFDGIFYYAVRTTGIFCRPSCKSKTPARENVVFYATPQEAIKSGFQICKKCRPDIAVFEPGLEVVNKAKSILNELYPAEIDIKEISGELGISVHHLIRLFRQNGGQTPTQYITALRIKRSLELLCRGNENVLDIAYAAGFKSLSNFYKQFKKYTGFSPSEFRQRKLNAT